MILIACILLLKKYGVHGAPLLDMETLVAGNIPSVRNLNVPASIGGCQDRSVWNILWSCLATTFACTWVSVHPNTPFDTESKWTVLRRRAFLMLYSLFAPEIMVMWAFKQWRGALMIRETINAALPSHVKPWTLTHAHFLQMGGFRVVLTSKENFGANTRRRHRKRSPVIPSQYARQSTLHGDIWEGPLTFDGLKNLLSRSLIQLPAITEDEIGDRSKGDAFSKGIALLQLTWFIAQIIVRDHQGLAVSEIELTTAALAGMNILMYLFWWSKPLDVRFPVVFPSDAASAIITEIHEAGPWKFAKAEFQLRKYFQLAITGALLDVLTIIDSYARSVPYAFLRARVQLASFIERVRDWISTQINWRGGRHRIPHEVTEANDFIENSLGVHDDTESESYKKTVHTITPWRSKLELLWKNRVLPWLVSPPYWIQLQFLGTIYCILAFIFYPLRHIYLNEINFDLSSGDMKDDFGGTYRSLEPLYDWKGLDLTMSTIFRSEKAKSTPLLVTSSLAGAIFGAIHCFAWNFDNSVQDIWRGASLAIIIVYCTTFIAALLYHPLQAKATRHSAIVHDIRVLYGFLLFFPMFLYPFFRLSLLILALVCLDSLPSSAFANPKWF